MSEHDLRQKPRTWPESAQKHAKLKASLMSEQSRWTVTIWLLTAVFAGSFVVALTGGHG